MAPGQNGNDFSIIATTIVTCLYDLASREPAARRLTVEEYLDHGQFLLGLDRPLLCFADPAIEPAIRAARAQHGLTDRTVVIPQALEDLPVHGLLESATAARAIHPVLNADLLKDTPLHGIVGWSKFEALTRAVALDPFRTTHFAWVDFGLAHVARTEHVDEDRVFIETPDRVRLLQMCPLDHSVLDDRAHHLQYRRGHFAGGLMTGRADHLQEYCRVVELELQRALEDRFAPLDEQLLELAVVQAPELFCFHHGDYDHVLANYRLLRGSAENLTYQLRTWRWAERWPPAAELAAAVVRSVTEGTMVCHGAALAQLLEECFIVSYHAHGDLSLARRCASLYAQWAHADPDFRDEFLRSEIRVRQNLGFVEQVV